jgi:hypothetical protein
LGYHLSASGSRAVFGEDYFPYPGLSRLPNVRGGYFAAFSAIDSGAAMYVDNCEACRLGTAYLEPMSDAGATQGTERAVRHIVGATSIAFLSATDGWVVGSTSSFGGRTLRWRIEHTTDGGATWTTQYQS